MSEQTLVFYLITLIDLSGCQSMTANINTSQCCSQQKAHYIVVVLLGTTLIVAWEPAHSKLRPRQLKLMLRHSLTHIFNGFLCISGLSQETVFLLLEQGASRQF